jgi:hypothetical protein
MAEAEMVTVVLLLCLGHQMLCLGLCRTKTGSWR